MISPRGVFIALVIGIGALHLMVADTRGSDWSTEGVALAVIGVLAVGFGLSLLRSRSAWPVIGSMSVSTAIIIGLVVTRTAGYPFGPFTDMTADLGPFEILVLITSAITVSLGGASLILGLDRIGSPGWRFDTLAPLAVVAAALPGLAVSSWVDDAAYLTGAAHVHGGTTIDSSTQHGFAYRTELSLDERQLLGDELTRARTAALSTPTLADAREQGWTTLGDPVPGAGQMMIALDSRRSDTAFDPATPVALLFASADDTAPIVAVQYEGWTSSTTPPVGFTGQEMFWHLHTGTCLVDDVRVVYDEPHVGANCELIGGERTNTISWMIRAWVLPGWENSNGTFAHDHPGLL
jgi:hypothetical protein